MCDLNPQCAPTASVNFNSLPPELVREVLTHLIGIPYHDFPNPRKRFGRREFSSARYLHVCTRLWHAGLPLLYNTVILRSPFQVRALLTTLRCSPELGLLVCNLRLEEGAYCGDLEEVLKKTPRVENLFLSLEVYRSSDISGLCKAFENLNPKRIILHDLGSTIIRNSAIDRVVEAVTHYIKCSDRLCAFEWRVAWRSKSFEVPRTKVLADALRQAPNLCTVFVSGSENRQLLSFIGRVLESQSLRKVYAVECSNKVRRKIRAGFPTWMDPQNRLVFSDDFAVHIIRKTDRVTPIVRRVLQRLPDEIWKRIIELALSSYTMLDETRFSDGLGQTNYKSFSKTRRSLMRVSSAFESAARPFFYHNMGIYYDKNADSRIRLLKKVAQSPNLCGLVRNLFIDVLPRARLGLGILDVCGLRNLSSLSMPVSPGDVRILASHLGRTLRAFDAFLDSDYDGAAFCPSDWTGFEALESLWLRQGKGMLVKSANRDRNMVPERVRFDNLRTLTVQDYENNLLFVLVSQWNLRYVERINIAGQILNPVASRCTPVLFSSLFETGKVHTLALGHSNENPDVAVFRLIPANKTVEKIIFCFEENQGRRQSQLAILSLFKGARLSRKFSALKEVQIFSQYAWPNSESEIRRSVWPEVLDELILEHGIVVTNGGGTRWRPHLR
ncbi:hypothetical protein M0805_005751 [Coniferiporia weirii]|nr:hypothetical protein M0805_005751 [Coniferiporia weirii]